MPQAFRHMFMSSPGVLIPAYNGTLSKMVPCIIKSTNIKKLSQGFNRYKNKWCPKYEIGTNGMALPKKLDYNDMHTVCKYTWCFEWCLKIQMLDIEISITLAMGHTLMSTVDGHSCFPWKIESNSTMYQKVQIQRQISKWYCWHYTMWNQYIHRKVMSQL